jgi:NAD(P)-dependent dehydrogenase (short-subunit alcohol dehydrogenase family)
MKYYITGTRRGLGKALQNKYGNCNSLEECDIFINCKHDGFLQVNLLYKAAELNKKIINISSNSGDGIKSHAHKYAVEKNAIDKANEQLFYQGVATTSLRFGYFDTERVAHIDADKMSVEYVISVIEWVLAQEYRVKEITITP